MRIKPFMILLYTITGVSIAIFTSIMTYLIIGAPIGMPMVYQIIIVILFMIPAIGLISYLFGRYLSDKFGFIQRRLDDIKQQKFDKDNSKNMLIEIDDINQNMNYLSTQMDTLMVTLRKKNKNLSNLLVSMAHDIKTPITILQGHIEEIEDEIVDKDALPQVLVQMKEELEFMDELTVDMLGFIMSMDDNRDKENINLHTLIKNEIFPILPQKDNITYINDVRHDFVLDFNRIDFKRVSINILSNAIRYTDSGHIAVYNIGDSIVFENTGEEILQKYRDEIFEPFYTIDKSKNRKTSGFGLGLSIVRNLSFNNGYRCYVYDSDTNRTIFYLEPTDES
ncbi:MAG TPA: HAMP domain-containing histidine kinase [Sulfurovum sp.]|nr:HAMP domain-containing histidine kinase [Sulfurovum sp.]